MENDRNNSQQIRWVHQEILQKTLITSYISIDGGLRPLPETLMAVARSFASYTSVRWGLAGRGWAA